jgi:hypothetical protein
MGTQQKLIKLTDEQYRDRLEAHARNASDIRKLKAELKAFRDGVNERVKQLESENAGIEDDLEMGGES